MGHHPVDRVNPQISHMSDGYPLGGRSLQRKVGGNMKGLNLERSRAQWTHDVRAGVWLSR